MPYSTNPLGTRHDDRPRFARALPASAATKPERILIERCNAGDDDAWDTLFRRYETPIYKMAYSLCHNHSRINRARCTLRQRLIKSIPEFEVST
jgi:hypothetical protein